MSVALTHPRLHRLTKGADLGGIVSINHAAVLRHGVAEHEPCVHRHGEAKGCRDRLEGLALILLYPDVKLLGSTG